MHMVALPPSKFIFDPSVLVASRKSIPTKLSNIWMHKYKSSSKVLTMYYSYKKKKNRTCTIHDLKKQFDL